MSAEPTTPANPPTLYLIDAYAQFFRAYHAIRSPMTSPVTKEPTNLTFGFVGMLLKLLRGEGRVGSAPTYVAVATDKSSDAGTFRSQIYPDYKAHRPPPPPDLFPQADRCLALLEAIGVPVVGAEGFEADDAIATVVTALRATHPDLRIRIVSKDKDLKSLLAAGPAAVELYDIHTDDLFTTETLLAETGLAPHQVPDMLTLMGDASDNVPGVDGIGPKTAAELVRTHGSLDGVIAAAHTIKGKRGEALRSAGPTIELARRLIALRHDAPVLLDLASARASAFHLDVLLPILRELGFNRYQDEVKALIDRRGNPGASGTSGRAAASTPSPTRVTAAASNTRSKAADAGPSLFDPAPAEGDLSAGGDAPLDLRIGREPNPHYRAVLTTADLRSLRDELATADRIAFDTETTGLSTRRCKLVGLSFATRRGAGWYVPVLSPRPADHLSLPAVLEVLAPILTDSKRPLCGHNLKFDLTVLRSHGLHIRPLTGPAAMRSAAHAAPDDLGPLQDSMIASFLIDSSRSSHGLDALALSLLNHSNIPISALIGSGPAQRTFDTVPIDLATQYAAEDADVALGLMELMGPQLNAMGLVSLFRDVEMPLVEVLSELEYNGIAVDPAELDRQRDRLQAAAAALRERIDDAAHESLGRTFNPDSPKQLAAALFNAPSDAEPGLGIKPIKKTKTGFSTDAEVLQQLADDATLATPIPKYIADYRQLTKLVSTYLVALKEAINPETGRIHASFNQTVAVTGRLSSSDPNLQNIPIRTDLGREIRRAFVAPPGTALVSADYSQIELRLLAHLSRDPALTQAFMDDQDIHAAVAAQIHGVPLEAVTREQRSGAKMVNFGIVYGVTPFGLARRLGIDNDAAATIIDSYKRRFAGITTFLHECIDQARRLGYVQTMLLRRRPIPEIDSPIPARRALAERTAINSVVQGSAADLIKLAMVDIQRAISDGVPALAGTTMLLQIHDELVLQSPVHLAEAARAEVVRRMESAMTISVPLRADSAVATNWFES